ncbi:PEP-CTERM sorting domain-containing protein [Planctomycetota bacterium]|nr:PEP-CTERM sorting domain-containing protein [Planctomycetota bacterium]
MKNSVYSCAIAASAVMSISAFTNTANAAISVDGRVTGDTYTHTQQYEFDVEGGNYGQRDGAVLRWDVVGGDLFVAFTLPTNVVDNSYGANSVGWDDNAANGKDHDYKDLSGSDKGEFTIRDSSGNNIFFTMDYLTLKVETDNKKDEIKKVELKDESELSVNGAKEIKADDKNPDPIWNQIMMDTSMEYNLDEFNIRDVEKDDPYLGTKYALYEDSPETTSSTSYDLVNPADANWAFDVTYEFKMSNALLNEANIDLNSLSIELGTFHASPNKLDKNKLENFVPVPEPSSAFLMIGATGLLVARNRSRKARK